MLDSEQISVANTGAPGWQWVSVQAPYSERAPTPILPWNFTFFEQVFLVGRWHTCQEPPIQAGQRQCGFQDWQDPGWWLLLLLCSSSLDHLLSEQCSVLLKTMIMLIIDTSVALSRCSWQSSCLRLSSWSSQLSCWRFLPCPILSSISKLSSSQNCHQDQVSDDHDEDWHLRKRGQRHFFFHPPTLNLTAIFLMIYLFLSFCFALFYLFIIPSTSLQLFSFTFSYFDHGSQNFIV